MARRAVGQLLRGRRRGLRVRRTSRERNGLVVLMGCLNLGLLLRRVRPVRRGPPAPRVCEPGREGGVGGCTHSMAGHVRDRRCVSRGARGRDRSWSSRLSGGSMRSSCQRACRANLQRSARERACAVDRLAWPRVMRHLRLEQRQRSLSAIRSPRGQDSALGLRQGQRARCSCCHPVIQSSLFGRVQARIDRSGHRRSRSERPGRVRAGGTSTRRSVRAATLRVAPAKCANTR